MCNLGRCYKRGYGVEQNWQEAVKWYEQGAQCGNLQSMNNLAYCYERGEGVEQNEDRALYWYRRGAEAGSVYCMFCLGWNYRNGVGVKQNMTEAIRWYTAAAEGGNADAMQSLGWHYDHGEGVEQDMKKAICWYERAAEQNYPAAMNSLGECYAMGRGVPRDLETAMEWYRRAAELGEAMADYNMGWHLEQAGKLSEAYAHYRKAADGNDDSAWWALGRFYENGVVVAQDGKEARRCYETGEKLGSVKCKMRLARCKLLGIGGRRAKKAGLDLCRQALELAKESSEKEDYGYEAEMNLLRRTIAENES